MSKLSGAKRIRDFVFYHRGTFTTRDVCQATGLDSRFIGRRLWELQQEGMIRRMATDGKIAIYTKIAKPMSKVRYHEKHKPVNPSVKPGLSDNELLNMRKKLSVSEMADLLGVSRQTVNERIRSARYRLLVG